MKFSLATTIAFIPLIAALPTHTLPRIDTTNIRAGQAANGGNAGAGGAASANTGFNGVAQFGGSATAIVAAPGGGFWVLFPTNTANAVGGSNSATILTGMAGAEGGAGGAGGKGGSNDITVLRRDALPEADARALAAAEASADAEANWVWWRAPPIDITNIRAWQSANGGTGGAGGAASANTGGNGVLQVAGNAGAAVFGGTRSTATATAGGNNAFINTGAAVAYGGNGGNGGAGGDNSITVE